MLGYFLGFVMASTLSVGLLLFTELGRFGEGMIFRYFHRLLKIQVISHWIPLLVGWRYISTFSCLSMNLREIDIVPVIQLWFFLWCHRFITLLEC